LYFSAAVSDLASSQREEVNYWLSDMEYLYHRSFNELETVFRTEFK